MQAYFIEATDDLVGAKLCNMPDELQVAVKEDIAVPSKAERAKAAAEARAEKKLQKKRDSERDKQENPK